MSTLNGQKASQAINSILGSLGVPPASNPPTGHLGTGKLYELYVLSRVLAELKNDGYKFQLSGPVITFKTSGGPIKSGDFHIDLYRRGQLVGQLYTDVEVFTLGWARGQVSDLSQYHEIDIVIVEPMTIGHPRPENILLGIECKATATFIKSHILEALGRRRELSYLVTPQPSRIFSSKYISATPASEYWLAFIDPAGSNYTHSPAEFSVELKHWQP